MIRHYMEIGKRTYALRFTLESIVRVQEILGMDLISLLNDEWDGRDCLMPLMYAGLCSGMPRISQTGVVEVILNGLGMGLEEQKMMDILLQALEDDGFGSESITRERVEEMLEAAARAGFSSPEKLCKMSLTEAQRALAVFEARRGKRSPMSAAKMEAVLRAYAKEVQA